MEYWIVAVDDEPLSLKNAREQLNKKGMRVTAQVAATLYPASEGHLLAEVRDGEFTTSISTIH